PCLSLLLSLLEFIGSARDSFRRGKVSIGANAVNGDLNKAGQKAFRLLPLNQQMTLLMRIAGVNDDDRRE
ncbi:hypothetical protein, partial [Ralstonia solanacearum]